MTRALGAGWRRNLAWHLATGIATGLLLSFILIPVATLFIAGGVSEFWAGLRHPLVGPALRLSLLTTLTSLTIIVLLGTPLAWLLAQRRAPLLRWVEVAIQLPVVIPPAVAGVALLFAFGRRGLIGSWLDRLDIQLAFTTAAVIMAEIFVAAPFFIQGAVASFQALDPNLIRVARTLGASPARLFLRVALPLSARGLIGGAAMSWARALGEFGATLMFAGNLSGKTQTLPLAIYTALESDVRVAQSLSVLLVGVAFTLLWAMRGGASTLIARSTGIARRGGGRVSTEGA